MFDKEKYIQEKITIDIKKANIFGLLILIPIALIYGVPYYLTWGVDNIISLSFPSFLFFIIVFIVGIVLHELIHGITWACYAKSRFKSIRFGIMAAFLTPYCHCKEPLKIKHYILGALAPALILGVIPAIYAIIAGNSLWLLFAIIFTNAACGDILVVWALRKEKRDNYVQDHPSEAGCYVYRSKKE